MLNNYICALDIGSSKISACVAQFQKRRISSMYFDSVASKGVKDGVIVDSISLISCIEKLLKNLKAKSGINIKFLHVNISGQDIITKHSRAIIPLAERGNKVITVSDMLRANEQARVLGSNLEEEIIHIIPSSYSIDSKSNISNPLGLYSHKLEVDLFLICGKLSSVQTLDRVINQSGYDVRGLSFSGLVTSKAVFDKGTKEGLSVFCDIGSDVTEILIFRDGLLKDIEIMPLGGNGLTSRLQEALKIPFELAEDIKRSYGVIGDSEMLDENKEILVKKSDFYKPIKQKAVSEVVTSAAKLMCLELKEAVEKRVPLYEINNFVVVGRALLLEGFIETLEATLSIPVKLGRVSKPEIVSLIKENNELSAQKYLAYLVPIGIICDTLESKPIGVLPVQSLPKNLLIKAFNRVKEVYQEYF
ncbi:MAG: cell division protein FtsA [Candidatus Omnitrophica bacterium]|nr:cell division protein FtsA [Candidatus Omnitrophota bacterium]